LGGQFPGELEPGRYRVVITYDCDGQSLTKSAEVEVK
jgi:hypothetical protein